MQDELSNALIQAERDWCASLAANDLDGIARYMHDDWMLTGSDCNVLTKQTFLYLLRSGELSHSKMDIRDSKTVATGQSGLVIAEISTAGQYQGKQFEQVERSTDLFVLQDGEWKCLLTYLQPLEEKP
ncbi:MAG: nuclear transport factor 2 family protein [Armatimonadetes bacterium]|nr:nuclear transport factor 2 family protein [Armatimonadota bacterium]